MAEPTLRSASHLSNDDENQGSMDSYLDRKLIESRTLLITGPITDQLASHCLSHLTIMESLDIERPITVFINTPGGSADSGFAIYDILRFIAPPIRTVVNGLCASAGILVHLAASSAQRFALPESRFMIHQPSTAGQGTASDLDITAREVLKLRERYNRIISEATGRGMDKVLEDSRRDFWLNSQEALKYKMIAKIIATRSELEK